MGLIGEQENALNFLPIAHMLRGLADFFTSLNQLCFFTLLSLFCSHRGAGSDHTYRLARSLLEASLLQLLNTIAKYNICSGKNPHLAGAVILLLCISHDIIIIRVVAN